MDPLLAPCKPLAFTSLSSLPPASASRVQRNISLEHFLPGPYSKPSSSSAALYQRVELSQHEARVKERIQTERRRPKSTVKVRGGESFALPNLPPAPATITSDEAAMSLCILGNKSCLVDQTSERYLDPDMLFTKPSGGFPTGISLAQSQRVADERMRKEMELKKREIEALAKASEEEEEEEKAEEIKVEVEVAPYPELAEQRAKRDEYSASQIKPWSVLDESDVSDFHSKLPKLALEYGFELDSFQKRAVLHLERGESVFAAAHTSAGKTVIAEYAIALALEHRTKLIYTSPIKALSNQKFRDFAEKFGPKRIGLLTGDNSVNPDAACVVMTTEILRSMLYRGAEMIRDVEFVVFDEIHYVNDADRGVIWEEVIIMLPLHVHVIMLSATTPNTMEFSAWVGRNRREQVFVVSTFKRPVPLEHYLYCGAGQRFLLMDSTGKFFPEAHKQAVNAMRAKDPFAEVVGGARAAPGTSSSSQAHFAMQKFQHSTTGGGSRNAKTGENRWLDLIKDLQRQDLLPVIVFTFSKRQVETRAASLLKLDLLQSNAEKSRVHVIIRKALARLQPADRELPQIKRVSDLLLRGIGIHHGGLLPILKEVVEICFTSGLVRALIATETFAMGVNAPCRTVCFGGLKKHDGVSFRELLPGEYIQMAGRSGRRGIDKVGSVIIHCEDDVPPLDVLSRMLTGKSSQLESRFRLRYSMILNLLRTDELSVADMMKRSFSEFSTLALRSQKAVEIKQLKKDLAKAKRVFAQIGSARAEGMSEFHANLHRIAQTVSLCMSDLMSGRRGTRAQEWALKPGRVVDVTLPEYNLFSLRCVVVHHYHQTASTAEGGGGGNFIVCAAKLPEAYKLTVLAEDIKLAKSAPAAPAQPAVSAAKPMPVKMKRKHDDDDDEFTVTSKKKKAVAGAAGAPHQQQPGEALTFELPPRILFGEDVVLLTASFQRNEIEFVSNTLLNTALAGNLRDRVLSKQRLEQDVRAVAALLTEEVVLDSYTSLNLVDLKVNDFELLKLWNEAEQLRQDKIWGSPCFASEHRELAKDVHQIETQLFALLKETSDESLALFPDFQARLQVLHNERMLNEDGVELKGRVACEINTCDELLLTEMIFENVFDDLDAGECCALLSALVLQGKCADQVEPPTEALTLAWERARAMAERLQREQEACGVRLPDDWTAEVLNPGLLLVTYEWARGLPFASLMSLTSLEEGTIVRAITRLDETCREVKNVSRLIGNPQLLLKMETASQMIKRDIVFATSLYVG